MFYLRLVGTPEEIYTTIEKIYTDSRKLIFRNQQGQFEMSFMDIFADDLLKKEILLDVVLPRITLRNILEELGKLEPRVSLLEEELDDMMQEQMNLEDQEQKSPRVKSSSQDELVRDVETNENYQTERSEKKKHKKEKKDKKHKKTSRRHEEDSDGDRSLENHGNARSRSRSRTDSSERGHKKKDKKDKKDKKKKSWKKIIEKNRKEREREIKSTTKHQTEQITSQPKVGSDEYWLEMRKKAGLT